MRLRFDIDRFLRTKTYRNGREMLRLVPVIRLVCRRYQTAATCGTSGTVTTFSPILVPAMFLKWNFDLNPSVKRASIKSFACPNVSGNEVEQYHRGNASNSAQAPFAAGKRTVMNPRGLGSGSRSVLPNANCRSFVPSLCMAAIRWHLNAVVAFLSGLRFRNWREHGYGIVARQRLQ